MAELTNGMIHSEGLGMIIRNVSISSSSNDLDIGLASFVVLRNTKGGSVDLTGLAAGSKNDAVAHQTILYNASSDDIVIKNGNVLSLSANQIYSKTGADITLTQHDSIKLFHVNLPERDGWKEI